MICPLSNGTKIGPFTVLDPDSFELIEIDQYGAQLNYESGNFHEIDFTIGIDEDTKGRQIQIIGVDLSEGGSITLTDNRNDGTLIFDNSLGGSGLYKLQISVIDSNGLSTFIHSDIKVTIGDTQYINYRDWDGSGSMVLEVDNDSDGTIDNTIILDNLRINYLPIIIIN